MRRVASLCPILSICALGAALFAAPAPSYLASPLRPYRLKLESFVPAPGQTMGVLLKVRINGGRPLHLILDSGAEHLVVTSGTARALGLDGRSQLSLVGFGKTEQHAEYAVAKTVEVGPLTFQNLTVDVLDHKVLDGADGVLPLALFSDFVVRLNFPAKVLDLTPYQPVESRGHFTSARAANAVLFLKTALNGLEERYFLLDTGAAHNAVSRETAKALGGPGLLAPSRAVQGAGGPSQVLQMTSAIHFRTAGHDITSGDVVLVDLDSMSRYNGFEVAGLLGYPALSRYVVTVNYRDAMVRMEDASAAAEPLQ